MKLLRSWSYAIYTYQLFSALSVGGILGVLAYQVLDKHVPNSPLLLFQTVRVGAVLCHAGIYFSLTFALDYFNEKPLLRLLTAMRGVTVALASLFYAELADNHMGSILKYATILISISFLISLFQIQAKPIRRWCQYLAYTLILTGIASTSPVQERMQSNLFNQLGSALFLVADVIILVINRIMIQVLRKDQEEKTLLESLEELGKQ